jgi:competence protein ComEA
MTFPTMKAVLAALALVVAAPSLAQDKPAPAKTPAKPQRQPRYKLKDPKAKLVDINAADKKDLMTLPGITSAYADKIIQGRPYLSKAKLASRDVLPMGVYQGISSLIEARQGAPAASK